MRKKNLYRCTSTFLTDTYCSGIFLKTQLSIRSGAHKLLCRFFSLFATNDRNFAKIVAPSGDENKNYVVHLKGASEKNFENCIKIDPKTMTQYLYKLRAGRSSVTIKKHHLFAPTAGARSFISSKLCTMIEDIETILDGVNHSSI